MNLDDQGIKHEAESMSGVVRGALFEILLDIQKYLPVFELPMQYKNRSQFLINISKVEGECFRHGVF
jgi:hypothetical protein